MADSPYFLRASHAPVWVHCAGSALLEASRDKESGPAAEDGTAAHWVLHQFMGGRQRSDVLGKAAENGVIVSEDMCEAATMAIDVVRAWGIPVYVEQQLAAPNLHAQCGGTPDVWGFDATKRLLRILDLKFGFETVDPFENWQLLVYLMAILYALGLHSVDGLTEQWYEVEFTIVQPRKSHREGPVRTWKTNVAHLRAQFNLLRAQAEKATMANPETIAGDHCDYCCARHDCATLQRSAYRAAVVAGDSVPFKLTPQAAARELMLFEDHLKILTARVEGLRVQVLADLEKGDRNQYFEMTRKGTRTVWQEGKEGEIIAMAQAFGIDVAKDVRAITPKQATDRGLPAEVVKQYSKTPQGEKTIQRIDLAKTRNLFGA